jgi:hypothetical protein
MVNMALTSGLNVELVLLGGEVSFVFGFVLMLAVSGGKRAATRLHIFLEVFDGLVDALLVSLFYAFVGANERG